MDRTVVIAGATGSIGSSLAKRLHETGRKLIVVSRNAEDAKKSVPYADTFCKWDLSKPEMLTEHCEGVEAVINLSGAPIFAKWKRGYENEIVNSRVLGTRYIVDAMRGCKKKPAVFINGSAAGYYGYSGGGEYTESSPPGNDFWGDLVKKWEEEAMKAEKAGIRTVLIRTSLFLKKSEGALGSLEPYFRKGLGGYVSPGSQMFPWIHWEDQISLIINAIEKKSFSGAVNSVTGSVSSKDFSTAIGKAMGKSSRLPIPGFAIKALFGKASVLVTGSQVIKSARQEELNFTPKYTTIEQAMEEIYGKKQN